MKLALLLVLFLNAFEARAENFDLQQYKGKVIYLDFWASWCEPCQQSFPWLNQINSNFKSKNVVVVGINLDRDRSQADAFIKQHKPNFKIYFDPEGLLAKRYSVKGMPYSVVIGKNGEVVSSHIGFHQSKIADYEKVIEGAVK